MKTAEDIISHHGVHARWDDEHGEAIEHTSLNAQDIQAIQLDALKEGMQKASKLSFYYINEDERDCVREDILIAAEQLTTKDL